MLGRLLAALLIVAALVAAAYFVGGLADMQMNGHPPSLSGLIQGAAISPRLDAYLSGLKHQAIWVSLADNAFSFQISWLGLILVMAILLFLRLLRRR